MLANILNKIPGVYAVRGLFEVLEAPNIFLSSITTVVLNPISFSSLQAITDLATKAFFLYQFLNLVKEDISNRNKEQIKIITAGAIGGLCGGYFGEGYDALGGMLAGGVVGLSLKIYNWKFPSPPTAKERMLEKIRKQQQIST